MTCSTNFVTRPSPLAQLVLLLVYPLGAVAYWAGRVPPADNPKTPRVNENLLFDCFDHLAGDADPARVNFRYVVALLLMRKRRLKFEDHRRLADGSEVMVLKDARNGGRVEVVDRELQGGVILDPGDGTDVRAGSAPTVAKRWGKKRVDDVLSRTRLP